MSSKLFEYKHSNIDFRKWQLERKLNKSLSLKKAALIKYYIIFVTCQKYNINVLNHFPFTDNGKIHWRLEEYWYNATNELLETLQKWDDSIDSLRPFALIERNNKDINFMIKHYIRELYHDIPIQAWYLL